MINQTLRAAVLAGCLGGAAFGAHQAAAQMPGVYLTTPNGDGLARARVTYRDLDLATPDGQMALRKRIQRAATLVCQPGDPTLFQMNMEYCRGVVRRGARPAMLAAIGRARATQVASAADPATGH